MKEKVQKILAKFGYGSRRYIESLIKLNLIKINNKIVNIGQRISLDTIENILINKNIYKFKLSKKKIIKKVLLYYKPEGELCSRKTQNGYSTVFSKLPYLYNSKWINIGRLDINSSGLLLFTTDGELAYRLMHPSFNIKRVYKVRVFGNFTSEVFYKLNSGVDLSDGHARFESVQFQYGQGKNKWFNVSLSEGRNRIIRRIWNKLGFKVNKLIRINYANLELPSTLSPGDWITLDEYQINMLYNKVNL